MKMPEKEKLVKKLNKLKLLYIDKLKNTQQELSKYKHHADLTFDDLVNIRHIAHKIAGSGATFGFPELSSKGRSLVSVTQEALLSLDFSLVHRNVHIFLQEIIKTISLDPKLSVSEAEYSIEYDKNINVYLLEDDEELSAFIASELEQENYIVSIFNSIAEINIAIENMSPLAIIADIILPEGESAGLNWITEFKKNNTLGIPVILLSQRDDFTARLKAVRAGAQYFLQKPVIISQLKYTLYECIYKKPYQPYRVMLIDDDEILSEALSIELRKNEIIVKVINNPALAIEKINEFKPELILMDLYMSYCTGLELGQIIRQLPEHASIPIVFMSSEYDTNKQLEVARLAGDDFIVKPIKNWRLTINVIARVKRARMINMYQEQLTKEIFHQKQHDILTGLPNMSSFEAATDVYISYAQKQESMVSLIWLDIDNFTNLNDALGRKKGDELLIAVSNKISEQLFHGQLLFRLGSDEYAVLWMGNHLIEKSVNFCEELMNNMKKPITLDNNQFHVSVSAGVSIFPINASNTADLIKKADIARNQAKLSGRSQYVLFEDSLEKKLLDKVLIEKELRTAINQEQFYLVYQPKYSLLEGKIIGLEALIRWKLPEYGEICPAEFIPIAESSNLITEITQWVLGESCKTINLCKKRGVKIPPIAINVSAKDLENSHFVSNLLNLKKTMGINSNEIELEMTERLLAEKDNIDVLNQLAGVGFDISIDDFGTGYSSLAILKKMPISLIKIDSSFVEDIPNDKDSCAISETIIRLAQSLRVKVLAEGVETNEQMTFLKANGCDYVQGFYYSKPLKEEAIFKLLS